MLVASILVLKIEDVKVVLKVMPARMKVMAHFLRKVKFCGFEESVASEKDMMLGSGSGSGGTDVFSLSTFLSGVSEESWHCDPFSRSWLIGGWIIGLRRTGSMAEVEMVLCASVMSVLGEGSAAAMLLKESMEEFGDGEATSVTEPALRCLEDMVGDGGQRRQGEFPMDRSSTASANIPMISAMTPSAVLLSSLAPSS